MIPYMVLTKLTSNAALETLNFVLPSNKTRGSTEGLKIPIILYHTFRSGFLKSNHWFYCSIKCASRTFRNFIAFQISPLNYRCMF